MKKLYKSLSFTAALLLMLASVALAQERVVSGTVTDENGSGMPGVNVLVKGTTTGTNTDVDGNYKISVPGDDAVLVFSFVGYAPSELTVGSRTSASIQLSQDVKTLTELVVTGYAVQEKRDVLGAVGVVKTSDLVSVPSSNFDQQLQGRVAGVTIINSGVPGQPSIVRIRGFSSLTANSAPLYVVDGTPTYDISTFSSYDIESISVLKDAGAASIYGARASNGVVLVTTKKGTKDGKMRVTYDTYYSIQDPGKGFTNLLNPQEQADLEWLTHKNDGAVNNSSMYGSGATPVVPEYITPTAGYTGPIGAGLPVDPALYNINYNKGAIYQVVKANKAGTDWFAEVTRKAPMQTHNLSIAGNSETAKYYLGLNYFNQKGIIIGTYSKRMSLRANTEFTIKKKVRVGENFNFSYNDAPGFTNLAEGNAISQSYRLQTIIPVHDEFGGYAGSNGPGLGNGANPVAIQERTVDNHGFAIRGFGNIYAEADLAKGLTARTSFGGFIGNYYFYAFNHRSYENSENPPSNGYQEGSGYGGNWVWTNTLNYKKTFGDHNLGVLLGMEAVKQGIGRNMNASRNTYFSTNPNFWSLNNGGTAINNNGGPSTPSTLYSIFGRVDYAFKDKYLLNATVRRDGSSKFGSDYAYGVFPSVTAGWRVSGESFMQSISAINDLKLRAGWGTMGNEGPIPSANRFEQFAGNVGTSFYDITGSNNGSAQGFRQTTFGTEKTKWEVNETSNIGLDATVLNNKLEITVEVYKKVTKDLLFGPDVAATYGFASPPTLNVAQMTNSGIDLQLLYRTTVANDWKVEANATFTKYKNNIDKIAPGYEFFDVDGGEVNRMGEAFVRNQVGHQLSSFYGYKVIGMNTSADTVGTGGASGTGLKQVGGTPGTFKFEDTNKDGKITSDDKQFLGSAIPKFTYGLNLNLTYKNFDLNVFFYGSYGNKIMNFTKWWTDFPGSFQGAKSEAALYNSWTTERTNGTTPMASSITSLSTNKSSNSYYLESGSYLRMRNIQLAYNLPATTLSRLGIQKARIFVQGVNLFTSTKYSGLNPELQGSDNGFGVDRGSYPIPKQYTVGLTISL